MAKSSLPSEEYVFEQLGLSYRHLVRSEQQLIDEVNSGPVPEGIWRLPSCPERLISVEVKRIAGNSLPMNDNPDGRKHLIKRGKIIWPWESTVKYAILKCSSDAIQQHNVQVHYAVFLIPESMGSSARQKTYKHIVNALQRVPPQPIKVKVMMMQGPDHLFYRF